MRNRPQAGSAIDTSPIPVSNSCQVFLSSTGRTANGERKFTLRASVQDRLGAGFFSNSRAARMPRIPSSTPQTVVWMMLRKGTIMNNLRKIAAGSSPPPRSRWPPAARATPPPMAPASTGKAVTVNEKVRQSHPPRRLRHHGRPREGRQEEGALNVIALPHDWSNYGEVIEGFKKKYPEIKVTELNRSSLAPWPSTASPPRLAPPSSGLMANQLAGGDINNLQPGLDFFKKLRRGRQPDHRRRDQRHHRLRPDRRGLRLDLQPGLLQEGAQGDKGVNWRYKTFPKAQVVSYYNQAINKDAPTRPPPAVVGVPVPRRPEPVVQRAAPTSAARFP